MALTLDDVRKIAHLARLELSDAEQELMAEQLNKLIEHVQIMDRVNTEGVPPTYHMVSTQLIRADKPHTSLTQEKALSQAPDAEAGCFKVPKITEG